MSCAALFGSTSESCIFVYFGFVTENCNTHCFNNSPAVGKCAHKVWRFPCSPATARYGEVIQRQYFCHHGGTICRHPKSSYVTTKLYGTSTCGCNIVIMRYFQTEPFSRFLPSPYAGHVGRGKALAVGARVARWYRCWIHYLNAFTNSFLPKYRAKYYDYSVKWLSEI